jgi:hypothetical protein
MAADETAKKPRGRPFPLGNKANPYGRPKGSRNKATLIVEALLDDEAEAIVRKVIERAKKGDLIALRLCLDRIAPARRDRPVRFTLPELGSAGDASRAMTAITIAVARGELTPAEAAELSRLIETYMRVLETSEFERRLRVLEDRQLGGRIIVP